ncbi:MAG: hypothetical protein ABSB49_16445 [Polyangia bacterium]
MRNLAALGTIAGLAITALGGSGCVDLSKPAAVQSCSANPSAPCVDRQGLSAVDAAGPASSTGASPGMGGGPGAGGATSAADATPGHDTAVASGGLTGSDGANLPESAPEAGQPDGPLAATDGPALLAPDGPGQRFSDAPVLGTDAPITPSPDASVADSAVPVSDKPASPPPDAGILDQAPGTSTTVTFANGLGVGVVSGYGWVAMGTDDTVSSPTCGSGHLPISGASPCENSTIWDEGNALCATGSVPALPTPTTSAVYAAYWGLQIGVNVKPASTSGPIGVAYRTITVNLTGSPTSGLRIELHRYGDSAGSDYCASLPVPAAPVPLTSFNTSCWDNSGTFLTTADAPNIDQISVQVTSGSSAITVDELCLDSIVLAE